MDCEIRLAKIDECLEIAQVKKKCWETTYRGIYSDAIIDCFDYEKNVKTFEKIIHSDRNDLYVAIIENQIKGFMSVGVMYHPYLDYEVEIGMLYLLEEVRGQGIGTLFFQLAVAVFKRGGYKEFIVSCNKYNEKALKFYSKMGCEIIHVDDDMEDKRYSQVKFIYRLED